MAKNYTSEAVASMIRAVQQYKTELDTNYQILVNAANVCDAAMGSDSLSARHIENLNSALVYLAKASALAEEATNELIRYKAAVDEII